MSDIFLLKFDAFDKVFSKDDFDMSHDALDDFLETSPLDRKVSKIGPCVNSSFLDNGKSLNVIVVYATQNPKRLVIYMTVASPSLKKFKSIYGKYFESNSPGFNYKIYLV